MQTLQEGRHWLLQKAPVRPPGMPVGVLESQMASAISDGVSEVYVVGRPSSHINCSLWQLPHATCRLSCVVACVQMSIVHGPHLYMYIVR